MGCRNHGLTQICRILQRRGQNEIGIAVGFFNKVVVFGEFCIRAVGYTVSSQVTGAQVRRCYLKRSRLRPAAATIAGYGETGTGAIEFPLGCRHALPIAASALSGAELEQPRLCSGIGFDFQPLVVTPRDYATGRECA